MFLMVQFTSFHLFTSSIISDMERDQSAKLIKIFRLRLDGTQKLLEPVPIVGLLTGICCVLYDYATDRQSFLLWTLKVSSFAQRNSLNLLLEPRRVTPTCPVHEMEFSQVLLNSIGEFGRSIILWKQYLHGIMLLVVTYLCSFN